MKEVKSGWKKNITIPNALSVLRLLVIYPCVVFFLREEYVWAALMLVISGLSDMFDGMIARHFDQYTPLGAMLDPVADKLTHGAIAVCLAFRYENMRWLVALMILKEGFMAVMGLINLRHKRKLDGARWFGKVCTGSLFAVLCVLVLFPGMKAETADVLICVEILIMTATLILYIPEFYKMKKTWEDL